LKAIVQNGPNDFARAGAVTALSQHWQGDSQVLPMLLDRARLDQDWFVRCAIVRELAFTWPDEDRLSFLLKLFREDQHERVQFRIISSLALGWRDHPDVLPFIKDSAVNARSDEVRSRALELLERYWPSDLEVVALAKGVRSQGSLGSEKQ